MTGFLDILPRILSMSLAAGVVIIIVLPVRLLLRRVPRAVSCLLWLVVLFRLLCPLYIESPISLLPELPQLRQGQLDAALPTLEFETPYDRAQNEWEDASKAPDEVHVYLSSTASATVWLTALWLAGVSAMLLWGLISYLRLRRRLREAMPLRENIRLADHIQTPFVLGLFRPQIYLPSTLTEPEQEMVLLHEQCHIRCLDPAVKLLAYLALCLHWFNPLVWLAFALSSRDLEMRCDEAVIRQLGPEVRADYAAALLRFATGRRFVVTPLAFGEGDPGARIRNLARWKKPVFWGVLAAVLVCLLVIVVCAADPYSTEPDLSFLNYENAISLVADRDVVMAIYCPPYVEDSNQGFIRIGEVPGNELAMYLDNAVWRPYWHGERRLPSPGSVEFVINDEHRITVYDSPSVAEVRYFEQVRWYRLGWGDYDKAVDMVRPPDTLLEQARENGE